LQEPLKTIPESLSDWGLTLNNGGNDLEYVFDASREQATIPALLRRLGELGIGFKDLNTRQSSLEDIFVSLVSERQ
jgi:ABC-2 type transport system ATP-binding protein